MKSLFPHCVGILPLIFITLFCVSVEVTFAAGATSPCISSYTPIVGIPGIEGGCLNTEGYVTALYYLSITVAALLAVYKIMEAGIKLMFEGVVGHSEARQQIQGAVFGLLIVLSAVLILRTINVNLTYLNIFGNAPSLSKIEEARNAPAPVEFGESITSVAGRSDAEIAALAESCQEVGGDFVKQTYQGGHNIPGGTNATCYAQVTTINAHPGDTFDESIYNPVTQDATWAQFKQSCFTNDGHTSDNWVDDNTCDTATVKVGDTLDLTGKYPSEIIELSLNFGSACASGNADYNNPEHTVLECLPPGAEPPYPD